MEYNGKEYLEFGTDPSSVEVHWI